MGQALDIVNRFYNLANEHQTTEGLDQLVADDVRFQGPLAAASNATDWMGIMTQFVPGVTGWNVLQQFENADSVCTIYELSLVPPNGNALTVPMAEWIRVFDGKIVEQTVYYDARPVAEAYGM